MLKPYYKIISCILYIIRDEVYSITGNALLPKYIYDILYYVYKHIYDAFIMHAVLINSIQIYNLL